jgi:hypothetical protein
MKPDGVMIKKHTLNKILWPLSDFWERDRMVAEADFLVVVF